MQGRTCKIFLTYTGYRETKILMETSIYSFLVWFTQSNRIVYTANNPGSRRGYMSTFPPSTREMHAIRSDFIRDGGSDAFLDADILFLRDNSIVPTPAQQEAFLRSRRFNHSASSRELWESILRAGASS